MIVDQPHGLHERIYGGRSDEFPALLLEFLRQRNRFGGGRCRLRPCKPIRGFVTPDEGCERAFLLDQFLRTPRIVDDGFDLAAMAHDAAVLEQALDVAPGEACDPVEIEIVKCRTEIVALGKDGAPAQSGLKAFQTKFLEQAMIVVDRETPFGVVIAEKLRCSARPTASCFAIRTQYGCHNARRPDIESNGFSIEQEGRHCWATKLGNKRLNFIAICLSSQTADAKYQI